MTIIIVPKYVLVACALIRYGFNSHGHQTVAGRLKVWPEMRGLLPSKMVGVNLGKNKTSDDACADYVRGVRTLGPHADYIVVNVSCPNMPGVKDMQGRKKLEELLDKVQGRHLKLVILFYFPLPLSQWCESVDCMFIVQHLVLFICKPRRY